MARKTPVPKEEIEIGRRLAQARETKLVSQTALAISAGIGRERLVKYESGLVPLPFWPGYQLCSILGINQGWLATGRGPMAPFIRMPSSIHDELWETIRRRALFSEIYRKKLKPMIDARTFIELAAEDLKGPASDPVNEGIFSMICLIKFRQVTPAFRRQFALELAGAADAIINRLPRAK
jgi:transcriptional regulator with XRE-family HTH domain